MDPYPTESLFGAEYASDRGIDAREDDARDDGNFKHHAHVKSEVVLGGSHKVYTLEELDEKIRNLTRLPPMRDEAYFHDVCGLHNNGTNLHRLQVKKNVSLSSLLDMFGKGRGRSGFKYMDCQDLEVRRFLEDIWLVCYGKARMPTTKLIEKEFCLGIIAQFELGLEMDWAGFAAETNANQRGKYAAHLRRWQSVR
jgi:hypothetical protein